MKGVGDASPTIDPETHPEAHPAPTVEEAAVLPIHALVMDGLLAVG